MELEEIKIKFPINSKVIPVSKSIGSSIEDCIIWNKACNRKQTYLYVVGYKMINLLRVRNVDLEDKDVYCLILDDTIHKSPTSTGGNYYKLSDVIQYKISKTDLLILIDEL